MLETLVVSTGVDPITGEVYPEITPVPRTPRRIYTLLSGGFRVQHITNGMKMELNPYTFYDAYISQIDGYRVASDEPVHKPIINDVIEEPKEVLVDETVADKVEFNKKKQK